MAQPIRLRNVQPGKEAEAREVEKLVARDARMLRGRGYTRKRAIDLALKMNFILVHRVISPPPK